MNEVTYKMALRDWQVGFRMGLSHMTPFYRVVWICLALLMTVGLLLVFSFACYPTPLPPTRLRLTPLPLTLGFLLGIILLAYASDIAIIGYLSRLLPVTVKISPLHLTCKFGFWAGLIRWKDVTEIIEVGEHICFCQNFPSATVVPKSAFPNQEQLRAFLETAEHHWRRETGRRDPTPPDVSGIWPPAPRAGNARELGDKL